MKRRFVLSICLVALVLVPIIVWLGQRNGTSSQTPKFTFAAILPLTGPLADLGENEKKGIELALDQLRKAGINQIAFSFHDSAGKPPVALSAVRQQYDLKGQRFFVLATTGPVLATLPALQQEKDSKVLIAQTMYPSVTTGFPFAARLFPSSDEEATLLATQANRQGAQRIAILHVNNEWGAESIKVFTKSLVHPNSIVAREQFAIPDKDFRSQIERIKTVNPDCLLVYAYPASFPSIVKQTIDSGLLVPILANSDFALASISSAFPEDHLKRVTFTAPKFYISNDSKPMKEFIEAAKASGFEPNFDIASFHDMTMIMNKAASLAPDRTPSGFLRGLEDALPYDGLIGRMEWSKDRDVVVHLTLVQWKDGKMARITN
ncbi:MAG: ABC transporter substrate-binding protein [Verrucomicrobiota bacterium]